MVTREFDAYREAKRQDRPLGDKTRLVVGIYERLQTFTAEIEELLAFVLLLLLREAVFGLGNLELALALEGDETDAQVCTT